MPRVLVAGATGYLGSHVVQELKRRGVWVRALARHPRQRADLSRWADDIVIAQVTRPETLRHVADDVDVVFSSIGITRQREHVTYEDVDYRGNLNLLQAATARSIARFVYVSIVNAGQLRDLAIVDAKERVVAALAESGISHTVIRPTGFFPDVAALLTMARRGIVVLFGDGTARINPISGRDLAATCADNIVRGGPAVDVGGPDVFSYDEIAALAFRVLRRRPRIWHLPDWTADILSRTVRACAPAGVSGPLEFVLAVTRRDMVAPRTGRDRLEDYFRQQLRERDGAGSAS
jgi:uncharacterized protein YbjT (DUF2867 family)